MTGPRVPLLTRRKLPPASPGLTGADLVEAKAQAENDAAEKRYEMAERDAQSGHPQRGWVDRLSSSAAASAQSGEDLSNIRAERDPAASDRLAMALAHLRALLGGRTP